MVELIELVRKSIQENTSDEMKNFSPQPRIHKNEKLLFVDRKTRKLRETENS